MAKQHVLRVLDRTGHTDVTFDPDNEVEVAEVRAKFDRIIGHGYMAYAGEAGSKTMEQVRTFDPQVEETIITIPIAGG